MKKVYVLLFLIVGGFVTNLHAQLLQWNTFGNIGTETTEPSVFNDPNLSGVTNLTPGAGITPAANGNRFGGSNWFDAGNTVAGNTLAEAIAGNNYIQFIVTPNSGFSFTPTSLVFTWDRSASGPSSVTLRSSADGFTADLGTVVGMVSGGAATTTPRTITISTLTNITTATTFRLYGYAATTTGGTGGFDNASNIVDVQLNGTTATAGGASITVTPTSLSGFTAAPGVGSAEQTYTVAGTGLTTDIIITPPVGFEIATVSGGPYTVNPSTITLTQTAGTVASQTIYVRMNSVIIGANTGNITHTSTGSNNPNVALTGNVVPLIPLTYVWIGLNGDWQVPTNWLPVRSFPATNDSLLFTSASLNDIITNVPTQTVGYIGASLFTGTTLQAAASGNTLTIGDLAGPDFFVEAGSSFNINTANALALNLVTGATAIINGAMTFTAGGHKIAAADAGAIVFNSGAVFTAGTGFTGNAFGTVTANSAIFSSGSIYRHISGGNPFFLAQPSSVVVFQTGSLYKQESILTPSVSGRVYANFEVVAPSLFPISASGASLLKMDNLTVTNGSITFSMTGGFDLKGNVSVAAGDTLHFTPASAASLNFNGTTAQSISNAGTLTFSANQDVVMNNAAGLTLNAPVTLSRILTFTSGLINTTATNLLTLSATALITGASNASFVNGPVSKIGNTAFVFPVGKTNCGPSATVNGYAAADIGNFIGGAVTDQYTAEYIRASGSALGPISAAGLDHVSACDHWTLNRDAGASTVDITLHWSDPVNNCTTASPYVNNLPSLTVAHFNGTNWDTYGVAGATSGTAAAGTVSWMAPQSATFGVFTIGSIDFNNPLPITINYFTGTKNNGKHLLNWKVTCISTPSATLEIERSNDGRSYTSMYSIFATNIRCAQPFDYTDNQPLAGVNYYRLKMTDVDGKITYSTTVALLNAITGFDMISIAPNPVVTDNFKLNVTSATASKMDITILDMQGRLLSRQTVQLIAGFNNIPVNAANLSAGTYILYGSVGDDKSRVMRFVKQ